MKFLCFMFYFFLSIPFLGPVSSPLWTTRCQRVFPLCKYLIKWNDYHCYEERMIFFPFLNPSPKIIKSGGFACCPRKHSFLSKCCCQIDVLGCFKTLFGLSSAWTFFFNGGKFFGWEIFEVFCCFCCYHCCYCYCHYHYCCCSLFLVFLLSSSIFRFPVPKIRSRTAYQLMKVCTEKDNKVFFNPVSFFSFFFPPFFFYWLSFSFSKEFCQEIIKHLAPVLDMTVLPGQPETVACLLVSPLSFFFPRFNWNLNFFSVFRIVQIKATFFKVPVPSCNSSPLISAFRLVVVVVGDVVHTLALFFPWSNLPSLPPPIHRAQNWSWARPWNTVKKHLSPTLLIGLHWMSKNILKILLLCLLIFWRGLIVQMREFCLLLGWLWSVHCSCWKSLCVCVFLFLLVSNCSLAFRVQTASMRAQVLQVLQRAVQSIGDQFFPYLSTSLHLLFRFLFLFFLFFLPFFLFI